MKIYGPVNSRTFRCIWTLEELGLDFDHVHVAMDKGEHRSPEFLEMNPLGKVPVLEHDGDYFFESAAICIYLSDLTDDHRLAPKAGAKERAYMNQWIHFGLTEMDAYLWTIMKHSALYPEELRSQGAVKAALKDFYRSLEVLSAHLSGQTYLLDSGFSVADIIVGQCLFWANSIEAIEITDEVLLTYQKRLKDRDGFPDVKAYLQRQSERQS